MPALIGGSFAADESRVPRPGLPVKTFGCSIVYLMGLFTLLRADHYLGMLL